MALRVRAPCADGSLKCGAIPSRHVGHNHEDESVDIALSNPLRECLEAAFRRVGSSLCQSLSAECRHPTGGLHLESRAWDSANHGSGSAGGKGAYADTGASSEAAVNARTRARTCARRSHPDAVRAAARRGSQSRPRARRRRCGGLRPRVRRPRGRRGRRLRIRRRRVPAAHTCRRAPARPRARARRARAPCRPAERRADAFAATLLPLHQLGPLGPVWQLRGTRRSSVRSLNRGVDECAEHVSAHRYAEERSVLPRPAPVRPPPTDQRNSTTPTLRRWSQVRSVGTASRAR